MIFVNGFYYKTKNSETLTFHPDVSPILIMKNKIKTGGKPKTGKSITRRLNPNKTATPDDQIKMEEGDRRYRETVMHHRDPNT